MLYIVATPIGNLQDITLRALSVLKSVDLIACEDTRQTKKLLDHYQISKQMVSYYEYNKIARGEMLLGLLRAGKDIAIVSDGGTPAISDPGFHIVRLALENNIAVSPIPGASSLAAALSVCGIPADRFIFEGFLSIKSGSRRRRLEELCQQKSTIVLFESPYRVLKLLKEIKEVFGNVELTIAREVTKKFEEIKRGPVDSLMEHFSKSRIRGEFVVVINNSFKQNVQANKVCF